MGNWKLIIVFVTMSVVSWGQLYTADREKFVKEFQKVMGEYGRSEFSELTKDKLPPILLESSAFSDEYFQRMVATCNLIEEKKMKPYPEVYNYVYSMYSLVNGKQSKESIDAWHSIIDKILDSRTPKKFTDYIELSSGFFAERRLNEKSNFQWYFLGGTFTFKDEKTPVIELKNGTLVCRIVDKNATGKNDQKYVDSIVIYNTSGQYDPVKKDWIGYGGKITWEKVGLNKDQVFAKIREYDADLKSSRMNADSVMLTSPYFAKPIQGRLFEEALKINREEDKKFPRFISNDQNLAIENIKPNLNYEGGFMMEGAKFVGAGSVNKPAKLTYFQDGLPFVTARSTSVYITDEKAYASKAQIAIILNTGDSISHPGLNFNYYIDRKELEFSRPSSGVGQSPFSDSYHKLDYYVPRIVWKEGGNSMHFTYEKGTNQEQRFAHFESKNYFDAKLYNDFQGMSTVHPLVSLYNYCYKYDKFFITEGECASALGGTLSQVRTLMLQIANYGFISYDTEAKTVIVNEKLGNFVDSRSGKKDYDFINFETDLRPKKINGYSDEQIQNDEYLRSVAEQFKEVTKKRALLDEFGNLNLSTLDLSLHAVDRVMISGKKNTNVFPQDGEVVVKQNRNFDFKGWMNAGKFEVNVELGNYDYKENKINLIETNESVFRVNPMAAEHGNKPISMRSLLSKVEGEILVDHPDNRAGNRTHEAYFRYPKLVVKEPSYVYYNANEIYNGAYDSTRFYYTVTPFEMDSLNTFDEASMRLSGTLTSAGIFPDIHEDLKIMPDYSFGFSTNAPSGGYDFYGNEAKYEDKIVLSNNGLQGKGTINFVHSTSISPALTFLPDSTVGLAKFVNRPIDTGIEFPDVFSHKAYITYIPKQNVLKAASTPENDLEFFNKEAKLKGTAIIRPKGMTGNGIMTFVTASLKSDEFKYKRNEIDADTSSLRLRNTYQEEGEDPLAVDANNMNAHISFIDRKGEFKSNNGEETKHFPVIQYMCRMDILTWYMDDELLEMEKSEDPEFNIDTGVDLAGPNFFSTHPKQDSLQFRAPKAHYNMRKKVMNCEKVEYIDVADARIFPDSMKVRIHKKAKMDELMNARIVANYITKYHSFENANVKITARRAYTGAGDYPYYDRDSVATYVRMENIGLDTSFQTIASGQITKEMNFKLSDEFDYYGELAVAAANPYAYFKGATRINHSCDKFERNWMTFETEIDPRNIQIPVAQSMKNLDGEAISAGIVWRDALTPDSIQLYPTFLSKLDNENDPIAITADGYLSYSFDAKEFQIGSKEKLLNRKSPGNFIALHTESCSMMGEGVVNLGLDLADVEVDAVGVVNYNQSTGETSMNLTMKMNMAMDKGLMTGVAKRIKEVEGMQPMDLASNTLEQAMINWTSEKDANKLKEDYTVNGEVKKLPKSLESSTMILTGVVLKSRDIANDNDKGLVTSLESAVLVSMYDEVVLKYVPMRALFLQRSSAAVGGDEFKMLIDIPGGLDYFFNYRVDKKGGKMQIVSGDNDFTTGINEMKPEKRKTKDFEYEIGSNALKSAFYNYFD